MPIVSTPWPMVRVWGKRCLNLPQSEFRMSVWLPWPLVWVSGWRQPTFRTNDFPQKNQYHCISNSFLGRIHVDNLGVIDAILSRGFSCYTASSNFFLAQNSMWFSVNIPCICSRILYIAEEEVEHFETLGGGGGLIFPLAIHMPLLKFSKMPSALFIGTSNLHSV